MKTLKITALLFPILTFMPQFANAQQMRTMSFDAASSMILPEFHAILVMEKNALNVEMKMGNEKATDGTDQLERGDIVLMMNGKRTNDIESIREIYESVEKDGELKIGVRRGEEQFIITAMKGTPTKGLEMSTTTRFESKNSNELAFSSADAAVFSINLGLFLANSDGQVKVERTVPLAMTDELIELDIEGYIITKFNNESKPNDASSFSKAIAKLPLGSNISLTFEKDGEEKSITFVKSKAQKNPLYIKGDN